MADEIAVIYQRCRPKKNTSEKNETKHKCRRDMKSLSRPNKPARRVNKIYYESLQENNEEFQCRVNNGPWTIKRENAVLQKVACLFPTQDPLEILANKRSTPEMNHTVREIKQNIMKRLSDAYFHANSPYRTNFIVNTVSLNPNTLPPEWQRVFKHPIMQAPLRIYRCQLSTAEETCCCSCNSDAMFEVMKGLYDCYKKKNCDNCNCVLCGHLAKEERKLAEKRKSQVAVGVETTSMKSIKTETMKKAKTARGVQDLGIEPEGRTPSEKSIIAKTKGPPKTKLVKSKAVGMAPSGLKPQISVARKLSQKQRKARASGFLTTLDGKSPEQKEKIIRGLAQSGLPLPDGKTESEKKLIEKVKNEISEKPLIAATTADKLAKAKAAGLLTPLDGKTSERKEKILRGLNQAGIPLPEGKTASEKALIQKIKGETKPAISPKVISPPQLPKSKTAGLLTPLDDKPSEKKERILRGLAHAGMPLPEGKTPTEQKLIEKVRKDLRLPPAPKTDEEKKKYANALAAGLISPLECKTPEQKEKILRGLAQAGIPLPEGKSASEKALIQKIKGEIKPTISLKGISPSQQAKPKAVGLLTPLDGKTPEQKEKILRGLAQAGIPLPEGKTASEKALIQKIKGETKPAISIKGISPSQRAKAKAAGLLTPLDGKTSEQKEKILRGLAQAGIPLPEGKTTSEKALIQKIKGETKPVISLKGISPSQQAKAKAAGLLTPLDGKTSEQKEKILRGLAQAGIPLPEGKTASEKALIQKIKETRPVISLKGISPSQQAKAKAAGLLTPLDGKTSEQKEKILRGLAQAGIPLPEGKMASEKALIQKIKGETKPAVSSKGIPPKKVAKAKAAGFLTTLDGKTPEQKEKILRGFAQTRIPLPEGKTPSEQKLIDKVRKDLRLPPGPKTDADKKKYATALAAGLITPLEGKIPEQKEKILRGLAQTGIALPEGKTTSEQKLIDKVKKDHRLPPVSTTEADKKKYANAQAAGLISPLKVKSQEQKEKILRDLAQASMPMPEAKTASEKVLITKIQGETKPAISVKGISPSQLAKAKAAGLLTPLDGKTSEQKEKILRGLAQAGVPLPEGKTASEKALIQKIKGEAKPVISLKGISPSQQAKARAAGLLTPLDGKTSEQKEKILRGLAQAGIPLPEGKTASEKALIQKIKGEAKPVISLKGIPPEKVAKDKAAGLPIPLDGKTAEQKEKIRKDLELPPTAKAAGLVSSLDGKTLEQKKQMGPPALPPKERAALEAETAKVITEGKGPADECICGLLTPESERESEPSTEKPTKTKSAGIYGLEGKTSKEKEKILKSLAKEPQGVITPGLPLPEGKTPSEKALIDKIKDGKPLPDGTTQPSAGIITTLEGKTPEQKEIALRKMKDAGLELPEGRSPSEKALINKIKASKPAAGIFTPLDGKSPAQKEKILKKMLAAGVPIPEGRTTSEKEIIKKVLAETPAKTTPTEETKPTDLLMSLKGKSPKEKENILRGQIQAGLPLPDDMTSSEKAMAKRIQDEDVKTKKDKMAGPSLTGKTKSEKIKILRELAEAGLPLPEGGTPSEKELVKLQLAAGLPKVVTTSDAKKFKDKKTGPKSMKKLTAARLGGAGAAAVGIQEEIQEIVKTDKCDAACGCDKKKIRFKHSYVKIRVTSPDISSFCPCPNECIPGVKAGVFTDNEGIKVTVGSVMCISSHFKQPSTAKTLQQSLMSIGKLTESQSLLLVKVSSMVSDGSSVGLSSKSTVYIYNSDSDVSISEIKRALRFNMSNVFFEEYFEDDIETEKSLSYIYRSPLASNRENVPDGCKWPHKPLMNPRKSFMLAETEPCLSLSRGSFCKINSLNMLSSLARRLECSSDSCGSQQSTYDDTDMFEPFYQETDLGPVTTLFRSRKSYFIKPRRNRESCTRREDLYGLTKPKLTSRCYGPKPHCGRKIIELNQYNPSSRTSSLIIVVSTSACDDGSSGIQQSDNSL